MTEPKASYLATTTLQDLLAIMPEEQIACLVETLHVVMAYGYGSVEIIVKQGKPHRTRIHLERDLTGVQVRGREKFRRPQDCPD